jgi:hypothetical protein
MKLIIVFRIWTSGQNLAQEPFRIEFCTILNRALISDALEAAPYVATVSKAINQLCVVRGVRDVVTLKYPPDGILWRGGQLPDKHRDFFRVGMKYRAPAFMSTSIDEKVAERFLYEASQHGACVKWKILLHPEGATNIKFRCKHVNYLEKSHFDTEAEFLFAPYSAFEVVKIELSVNPNYMSPHLITLRCNPNISESHHFHRSLRSSF